MDRTELRSVLLGDGWDSLGTAAVLGFLSVVILNPLFTLLDSNAYIDAIYILVYAVTVAFILAVTIYSEGGLVQAWIGISPIVFFGILRNVSYTPFWSVTVGAFVFIFGVGTAAYIVMKSVWIPVVEELPAPDSSTKPETTETADGGDHESPAPPGEDGQSDRSSQRTIPVTRRQVVYTLGGGGTFIGAIFGDVYGWWCDTSPADVLIENESGTIVDLEVTISRYGHEVFQKEFTLGLLKDRVSGEPRDPEDLSRREFENAIPIGCGTPEEVHVEIETDYGLATADTARFPAPDPPPSGGVAGSALHITLFDDEIDLEADFSYWAV